MSELPVSGLPQNHIYNYIHMLDITEKEYIHVCFSVTTFSLESVLVFHDDGEVSAHEQGPQAPAWIDIIPIGIINSCVDGTVSILTLHPDKRTVRTVLERERGAENTGTRP